LDRVAATLDLGWTGADLVAAAVAGNGVASVEVDRIAGWFAVGIENLMLALDPDVIVVGGILSAVGSALLDPMQRHLNGAQGSLGLTRLSPVVAATSGDRAGLEGAMIGAMEVLA